MTAFVTTVDTGGLSAAARRLGRSPAAVTRAVAFLEASLGVKLLRRTTRSVKITEAGDRYLVVCRRVLAELGEAARVARGALDKPLGTLTVTAPLSLGTLYVRSLVDAYRTRYPDVRVRLSLLDRLVNLVDEGIDIAIRIAHMPDSALMAVKLGEVRRVLCASPKYLARHGVPKTPAALGQHACIAFGALTPTDTWTIGGGRSGVRAHHVKVSPGLMVNSAEAAMGSAMEGHGITCLLSYQAARALREGRLVRLLPSYESSPVPVHLVYAAANITIAKVRAFIDLAVPRLRAALAEP